ncbi:MAG: sulfotransferase [Bacteroidetes bacterium]|nr:sulfotransferase [Bacteroidota bacterium]
MNRWPNFLIVGTARAGTTSLHEFLGGHPDIYMPLQKEPCFFTFYNEQPSFKDSKHRYTTTVESYSELFDGHQEKIMGESSTPYLYFHQKSIEHIKQLVPDYRKVKILIVLRDPAERAYSQYMHNRRDLLETATFETAIAEEKQRMAENWHFDFFYVDKGYYYEQVKSYLDNFDNVKIVFYDTLEKNPDKLLSEIYEFLDVPQQGQKEMVKRNQSGEMKVKWFKQIITTRKNPILNFFRKLMSRETKKKLRNWVKDKLLRYNLKKTEMNPETRKQLIELYKNDIIKLQSLVNKDLSDWMRI